MKTKVLSFILCMTLFLSLCPALPISAAETVLFSDDFSTYDVDSAPSATANTQGVWSSVVQKDTVKVAVVEEAKNKILRLSNDGDNTLRGPRIEKYLNLNEIDTLTIAFRVRVDGATAANGAKFALQWLTDGQTNTQLFYTNSAEWKDVTVTVNKQSLTAKITVNGTVTDEKRGINPVTDWATCQFRFAGSVADGMQILLDDVTFSTDKATDVALANAGGKG